MDLPFNTIVVNERDVEDPNVTLYRANLRSAHDAGEWLAHYERATSTHWVVRKTYPSLTKMLFRKDFCCHHTSFSRVVPSSVAENQLSQPVTKRGRSKNCGCSATLVVKICLKTSKDQYAKVCLTRRYSGLKCTTVLVQVLVPLHFTVHRNATSVVSVSVCTVYSTPATVHFAVSHFAVSHYHNP